MKEQPCYELYKNSETSEFYLESTVRFVGQSVSFSSSLPASVAGSGPGPGLGHGPLAPQSAPPPPLGAPPPLADDEAKKKKRK